MTEREMKYISVEIKAVNPDGTFSGVASMYGQEDLVNDVIDKGAFTKTLSENPVVPVLWQHKTDEVIGSGTVKEWGNKITIDGQLDLGDPTADKAYRKMKASLVKGLSIGFRTVKSAWEQVEDRMVRHISELKLWEVSVVTFPALPAAQVTRLKSAEEIEIGARLARLEKEFQALQTTKGTPEEPPKVKEPPTVRPAEPDWVHSADAVLQTLKG